MKTNEQLAGILRHHTNMFLYHLKTQAKAPRIKRDLALIDDAALHWLANKPRQGSKRTLVRLTQDDEVEMLIALTESNPFGNQFFLSKDEARELAINLIGVSNGSFPAVSDEN
jgi:hypothetical protein